LKELYLALLHDVIKNNYFNFFTMHSWEYLFQRLWLQALLLLSSVALGIDPASAHETWLLNGYQQAQAALQKPWPMFQGLHPVNLILCTLAALTVLTALILDAPLKTREERFLQRAWSHPRVPRWLTPSNVAAVACAFGLIVLIIPAALGYAPRHGTGMAITPTLFVADLELKEKGALWTSVLRTAQLLVAGFLILGLFPHSFARACRDFGAIGVLLLLLCGLYLFGASAVGYLGHIAAPALFLILVDRLPEKTLQSLLCALVGANFIYLALIYKFYQPHLLASIVIEGNVPTLGLPLEVIVYTMGLVELVIGMFLFIGVCVRAASLLILGALIFFMVVLSESPHIHANIFGVLVPLLLLGNGGLRGSHSQDTPLRSVALKPSLLILR
jgi:uncharacterized membrane protein YphA (DoxX/SURF4 family)